MAARGPRALVITADARVSLVDTPAGELALLKWLQQTVGGYVECVHPGDDGTAVIDWHAYVNEDGKLEGLRENMVATALAQQAGWLASDILAGTVVFMGHDGEDECDVPTDLIGLGVSSGLLTGLRGRGDG